MRDLGYLEDYATGEFDEATRDALQAFQRANNLEATGVANQATIDRLEDVHVLPGEVEEPTPERPDVEERQELIYLASTLVGTPFVFGGATLDGFDASGFIYYVYSQKGHSIPRTIRDQYEASRSVERPNVGDLVFFDSSGGPTYVGMYVGNQTFVHASQSQGVTVSSLEQGYWKERFIEARTIITK
ncbi:cell wall-associated NlpC family hydrolase [Geomicrobium sediminis]|uniref:Cell wall-associated NlpC family hydrolase n=1 Tax=Geomicrobium sediminis TaxID=1347788 RepID=A0ABS2P7R5_9BACL|nr:cell wall-associated NlpC family hydrolase [Geomicrobium sediminis]